MASQLIAHAVGILCILVVAFQVAAGLEASFGLGWLWWPLFFLPALFCCGVLASALDHFIGKRPPS